MDIFEQLIRDEGYRKFPYVDTVGKVTIGVGWNLTDDGMSDAEIEAHLTAKVAEVTADLKSRLPWFHALDPVRQGVLVNLGFNVGLADLEEFEKMLHAFAQGNFDNAAAEMLDSKWAKQVGARAQRLAQQVRTGIWT